MTADRHEAEPATGRGETPARSALVALRAARFRINRDRYWIRGRDAMDGNGRPCQPESRNAVRWGLMGALKLAVDGEHDGEDVLIDVGVELLRTLREDDQLRRTFGPGIVVTVTGWANHEDRSYTDVMDLLDATIERVELIGLTTVRET